MRQKNIDRNKMAKHLLKTLILGLFLILSAQAYAQRDLIITQAGEEIRCKILDETPTRFIYAYLGPKKKVLRNEIFKNLVTSFKYNHYDNDILINPKLETKNKNTASPRVDTRKGSEAKKISKKEAKRMRQAEEQAAKSEAKKEDLKKETPKTKEPSKKEIEQKKEELVKAEPIKKESEAAKPAVEIAKKTEPELIKKAEPAVKEAISAKQTEDKAITQEKALEPKVEPIKVAAEETIKETEKKVEVVAEKPKKIEDKAIAEVEKPKKETTEKSPFAEPEAKSEFKNYLKYRVGFKGGLGNIITKTTDTSPFGLFKEKLNRGRTFGADAAYFITDNFGMGVTFTNYQASNKNTNFDYPNLFTGETIKAGSLNSRVSHKFVGPTLLYRKPIDFKTFAIITISPGMHLYTDKGQTNAANYKFTGQGFGGAATLGLDFLLGNDIYGRDIILSLEGGYNYGQITALNDGTGAGTKNIATPINLNRLDFTIGLRFTRFPAYLR